MLNIKIQNKLMSAAVNEVNIGPNFCNKTEFSSIESMATLTETRYAMIETIIDSAKIMHNKTKDEESMR
jgi:hypothetical protein